MKTRSFFTFLLVSFLFISHSFFSQIIYTNGGISTGTTSASGVVAPTGYSWSEMQNNTGNFTQVNASSGFPGYYNTAGTTSYSLADDFVVPVNQTWNVTSFDFYAYLTDYLPTALPINQLRVRIFNVNPTTAGATPIIGNFTANVLDVAGSENAFIYRIFNSSYPLGNSQPTNTSRKVWKFRANLPTTLTPGTYWVEYQVKANANESVFFPATTIVGNRGNATANSKVHTIASTFSGDTIGWSSNIDGGVPTSAPDYPQDMAFNINGAIVNLGLYQNEFDANFVVYPNPASSKITIVENDEIAVNSVEIYDIYSRLIIRSNHLDFDVSQLSNGNYILKINSDKGIVTKKIIKN